MRQTIIDTLKSYPTDGTHKYHWVNGFDGVTKDLIFKEKSIAKSEALQRTYCCGLTFEVYFKVLMQGTNCPLTLTPKELLNIKRDWFVAAGGRKGPVDALVTRGLGIEIKPPHKGQTGDFAQIWRKNGSGHSVIVIEHTDDFLKYWSTQPSTDGIGYRTEFFKNVKNPITEIYVAQAIKK